MIELHVIISDNGQVLADSTVEMRPTVSDKGNPGLYCGRVALGDMLYLLNANINMSTTGNGGKVQEFIASHAAEYKLAAENKAAQTATSGAKIDPKSLLKAALTSTSTATSEQPPATSEQTSATHSGNSSAKLDPNSLPQSAIKAAKQAKIELSDSLRAKIASGYNATTDKPLTISQWQRFITTASK